MTKKNYYEEHKEIMDAQHKAWSQQNSLTWNTYLRKMQELLQEEVTA